MKQILSLLMIGFLLVGIFSTGFVLAQENSTDDSENEIKVEIKSTTSKVEVNYEGTEDEYTLDLTDQEEILAEIASRLNVSVEDIRDLVEFKIDDDDDSDSDEDSEDEDSERTVEVTHEFTNENGNKVHIKTKTITENGEERVEYKVRVKGVDVNSKFELKQVEEDGEFKLKVVGKGDVEESLNYLPDDIADIASGLLNVTQEDLNITLTDGVHKNVPKVVYNVETNKNGKFLGIWKLKVKVEAQIDPETGELIGVSTPWWAFLVQDSSDDDSDDMDNDMDNDNNETENNETNSTN